MPSEIVMYIIVNKELKMSPAKLAVQVAHSAIKAYMLGCQMSLDEAKKWFYGSYTKIVLKASEYEMREMMKKYGDTVFTIDEGRTEIPKNSLTTIAFIPMPKDLAPKDVQELKLL